MRPNKTATAAATALMGVLAACSGGEGSDPVAGEKQKASAAPTQDCPAVAFHHDDLDPGCWAIQVRGLSGGPLAQLDLPAGFSGNDAWVWANDVRDDEWGAITLMSVGDVYADPCARTAAPPKVGPSVEDFASALATQKVTTATKPDSVSLDGHEAVYLEMSVPDGFDVSTCRDEELILWGDTEESPGAEPGLVSRYWLLDLEGQRVVLAVNTNAAATRDTVKRFIGIAQAATFTDG